MTRTRTLVIALAMGMLQQASDQLMAQTIVIPDLNMRNWLNMQVPGCVDAGGNMDTVWTMAQTPVTPFYTELQVSWPNSDLTGLTYIQAVTLIVQYANPISTVLPAFPASMETIFLSGYPNATIPSFPVGINQVEIWDCPTLTGLPPFQSPFNILVLDDLPQFTSLPPLVSAGAYTSSLELVALPLLTTVPALTGGWKQVQFRDLPLLTDLPALPSTVRFLRTDDLPLVTALPASLPTGLQTMWVNHMDGLTTLPTTVPAGFMDMRFVDVPLITGLPMTLPTGFNAIELSALPLFTGVLTLPTTVAVIYLRECPLLPQLTQWPPQLSYLELTELPLWDSIPALAQTQLLYMTLDSMLNITTVPALSPNCDSLAFIDCPGVSCLPHLPNTFSTLRQVNGSITCIPNITPWWEPGQNYPLCTPLNSACDLVNPVATGTLYHDVNANGVQDPGETGVPYAHIEESPQNSLTAGDPNGDYQLPLDPGVHTLVARSTNPYVVSIAPTSHSANLVNITDVDSLNDFGIVLQANVQDLVVSVTAEPARPGFDNLVWVQCSNIGTVPVNGSVNFTFDPDQTWVGSSTTPTTLIGNTAAWAFTALPLGGSVVHTITLHTDSAIALGTPLHHVLQAEPMATDQTPLDNTTQLVDSVVGSFDPNDKLLSPMELLPAELLSGPYLNYTIRFQNTGTYPAERVVITDALDQALVASSLQVLSSSHACTWTLLDGTLRVVFDPIALPDSATDQLGSNGFVRFRIRPSAGLLPGTQVPNHANIFFDYNLPVITDPVVFTVLDPSGVNDEQAEQLVLFPSPTGGLLWLRSSSLGGNAMPVEVIDATGRLVLREQAFLHHRPLDVSALPAGAYLLRVQGPKGWSTARFTKL